MRLVWPLVFFVTMTFTPACGLFEPEHPTITVVKGDTLSKLARANGVTVAQLKEWNGLSSDTIEIGQVLVLKVNSPTDAAAVAAPTPSRTPRRRAKGLTVRAPDAATSQAAAAPSFTMPAAKPCLAGPTSHEGDEGLGASARLRLDDYRASMNTFLHLPAPCLP